MNEREGNVFEIQHFSIDDGPGIRTTVFLKGCQMRCLWCHNPESLKSGRGILSFVASRCVNCGLCFRVCPEKCHSLEEGKHRIDREKCIGCGRCTRLCAGRALTLYGERPLSVAEVMAEVLKDRVYYEESGGGLTISGGEPMTQPAFVRALASEATYCGIHVVLETNACYEYSLLESLKDTVDVYLVDWKVTDEALHRKYTGHSNRLVEENIRRLHRDGRRVILRCPIIPGYNDTEDHFQKIAAFTRELPGLVGAQLMPYHSLGLGKIQRFGLEGQVDYITAQPPTAETLRGWVQLCQSLGGRMLNEI